MKKLKLKSLDLASAELLTRQQLKMILGGDGSGYKTCSDESCLLGSKCFYTGPDGCGIATVVASGGGNCGYSIVITTDPPCGWA